MYSSIIPVVGWIFTLAILAIAWWKGARPEKYGALAILIMAVNVWAIETFAPKSSVTLLLLLSDGALAVAFLVLAVRYASLWVGLAMIFQAVQFALHAYYTTAELAYDRTYAMVNNLVTAGILLVILTGSIVSWRRRSARRRAAV